MRYGTCYGKPIFPDVSAETKLFNLVGPDSHLFFKVFKIDPSFLRKHPREWSDDQHFQAGKVVVNALRVVNDSAERGVKLATDFLGSAKIEERFQQVLQTVEMHRQALPSLRKRKIHGDTQLAEIWHLVFGEKGSA